MGDTEAAYRLPRSVIPSRYGLTIEPDLHAGVFSGHEEVAVTIHEPVTEIVLNAKELQVEGGELSAEDRRVAIDTIVPDPEAERVTLILGERIEPGEWVLRLSFRGELNQRMVGFYRSTYEDDGVERVIATSHFEATDARMCFPCWDEPDLKAVFGITLVVDGDLAALSNGPEVERERLEDGKVRIRFADTMVMSTYLVCLVVGPLVVTEPTDARGVPVRVACRPGQDHLVRFGLDAAVFSLNWFGDYYAIPYPDAKLDNVAIPDFAQGAMENLGCVTYRETLLLLDPAATTPEEQLGVAETVAHELAHMWFGDLVTMRWWNGIWLNEAFATFMSYLAVDAMHPEWRVWDSFTRIRANAFEVDALESTRTIEYPVASPDDASGMFDTLTYTKGGAVLRMLEQWLGPERFRDGIRRYLAKHAYGNTETHDLWDALESETGEPVRRVMDAWIFQPGYPAISASLEGEAVWLRQHRFIPSHPDDGTTWPVPLLVRQVTPGGEHVDRVLVEAEGLSVPLVSPDARVIVNAGAASFVRVFHDDELRSRLAERAFADLTPVERQCLVDDAWAAVVAGDASAGSFIDLVGGFAGEDDLSVWRAILTGLGWCDRFLEGAPRDRFRDFVRDLVRPPFARLGWEGRDGDSALDRELRGELVRALAVLGDDPETQAQARESEREASVEPAVAAASVDVVATLGGVDEFERFFATAKDASTPQEQERYREALARFRDPVLMDRLLAASLDQLRPQDAPFVLARSVMNRDLGGQAWRFIADHWKELGERFAASNVIVLAVGVRTLTRTDEVDHVQRFFADHDIPQNHQMLEQALERQRVFAALHRRAAPDLERRFGGPSSS